MAETYKSQPNNPVKFLAKWLINYNLASVKEDQIKDDEKKAVSKRAEHDKALKKEVVQQKEIQEQKDEKQKNIDAFHKKYQESDDLEDHLQELSDFVSVSISPPNPQQFRNTQRLPLCTLEDWKNRRKK